MKILYNILKRKLYYLFKKYYNDSVIKMMLVKMMGYFLLQLANSFSIESSIAYMLSTQKYLIVQTCFKICLLSIY